MAWYSLLFSIAAVSAALLTGQVRRRALVRGHLDYPNERSSHTLPTPRGGGVAIVAVTTVVALLLAAAGAIEVPLTIALVAGGLAVAWIGHVDDRRSLSASVRLAVHFGAAVLAVAVLGGMPPIQWGGSVLADAGVAGDALAVLAIVWSINLFNFMDGIDGLAASEAAFISGAGALLAAVHGAGGFPAAAVVVCGASVGFLLWNWAPAKIFMGDVGSGYLGYVIAVLALAAMREGASAAYAWLVLGGVFFLDATLTLLRRAARRERVFDAHRIHGYQWLARRLHSHLRATVIVLLVNVLWLLPMAWIAYRRPDLAGWLTVGALLPVAIGLLAIGAGRPESPAREYVSKREQVQEPNSG